jgi:hypothetical protein
MHQRASIFRRHNHGLGRCLTGRHVLFGRGQLQNELRGVVKR